jgi:hypothetical protein
LGAAIVVALALPSATAGGDVTTVLLAGDIADGTPESREADTAALVAARRGLVVTTGDNAYDSGTYEEFLTKYDPTWGRFLERTRATPGNHEYFTPGAAGYFRYFGERAGPAGRGYHTFRAGTWRVVSLDSESCKAAGGCGPGTAQHTWLKRLLARTTERCTLAVWHSPRFSSGYHGDEPRVAPLLELLYRDGAEIVVNGHEHWYERLAPARPDGRVDGRHGIRQFVVGTGGAELRGPGDRTAAHSRVFEARTWGVLQLRLHEDSYAWRFLPVAGQTFTDAGSGRCHGRP